MAVTKVSRSFKDIDLSFKPHPVTNDLTIIRNESAIKKSIKNLVQTNLTERFFNLTIGSDVRNRLFDFVDVGTASLIEKQIELVIQNYEPRVDNLNINVDPRVDENSFDVTITFNIIGQDFPLQQFNFILEATR